MRPPDESSWLERHAAEDARAVARVLAPLLPAQALRGPVLFVAAHPDDEVLGASWLLRRSPGCHVVHVTDGLPRDLDAPGTPYLREARARLREKESFTALALAGVPPDHLLSLGAAELEAAHELVPLTHCLVALLKALRPTLLVVPPYEGRHPDHDAAAFISHTAVALLTRLGRTPPTLLEMAMSPQGFQDAPDGRPVVTVSFPEAERTAKRRLLASYASRARELSSCPVGQEHYRAAPRYDFTRAASDSRWAARARRALEELKLPEAPWH